MKWESVSSVIAIVACPRSSCTNLGCTPFDSSKVAQVMKSAVRETGSLEERCK